MSYHVTIFTIVPSITAVSPLSKIDEYGFVTMSEDTIGSSVYWRIPFRAPLSATAAKAALTSSTDVSRTASNVRSTTEPVGTGARTAKPCSLPLSSGSTRPTAFAAPVDVGTRLIAAARARRRSLCGASWRFWSAV